MYILTSQSNCLIPNRVLVSFRRRHVCPVKQKALVTAILLRMMRAQPCFLNRVGLQSVPRLARPLVSYVQLRHPASSLITGYKTQSSEDLASKSARETTSFDPTGCANVLKRLAL